MPKHILLVLARVFSKLGHSSQCTVLALFQTFLWISMADLYIKTNKQPLSNEILSDRGGSVDQLNDPHSSSDHNIEGAPSQYLTSHHYAEKHRFQFSAVVLASKLAYMNFKWSLQPPHELTQSD